MTFPDFDRFSELSAHGTLIPVYREIMADMDTPVSAFLKIDNGTSSFLLESIEGGEKWARYTFLGSGPATIVRSKGRLVEVQRGDATTRSESDDPTTVLSQILAGFTPVEVPGLPRFIGGAVGYLGYDMVRHFERLPSETPDPIGAWDSYFMITDTLLIFDTVKQKIQVVATVDTTAVPSLAEGYQQACDKIDALVALLGEPHPRTSRTASASHSVDFKSLTSKEQFEAAVVTAKEYVKSGDIIQVVLSQRMSGSPTVQPTGERP